MSSLLTRIRDTVSPGAAAVREQNKLLRQEIKRLRQGQERVLEGLGKLAESQAESRRSTDAARHRVEQISTTAKALEKRLARVDRQLEGLDASRKKDAHRHGWELKGIKYWAKVFELQLQALLRHAYLEPDQLPYPHRLVASRFRLTSQNQEDGLTWAILSIAGAKTRKFVEIGCGMNGGNSGFLAAELGWKGLMIDADDYKVQRLVGQLGDGVVGTGAWVTRENVNDIITEANLTGEVDIFSLDIDSTDYWIWESLEACTPRLVIIEYNAMFGAERAVVVPYDANFDRHDLSALGEMGRYYFGASLAALVHLGNKRGYRLVASEPEGSNAFFLRNDVAAEIPAVSVADAFHMSQNYAAVAQRSEHDLFDVLERNGIAVVDVG